KWRNVKMTALPGLDDIARELRKAEESQRIEQIRRDVIAPLERGSPAPQGVPPDENAAGHETRAPNSTKNDATDDPTRPRPRASSSSSNQSAERVEHEDEGRGTRTIGPRPGLNGVILLNSARLVNGRYEIGPLLSSPAGQLIGVGVRNGPAAVEKI